MEKQIGLSETEEKATFSYAVTVAPSKRKFNIGDRVYVCDEQTLVFLQAGTVIKVYYPNNKPVYIVAFDRMGQEGKIALDGHQLREFAVR